ncbi:hypothetical protein MCT03_12155 [Vibrio aestuarianus]|nr:hypothetical protein [Vibrio aestuarianus]
MSAVKLYFCTFYDDAPTQVSVHRDLNTLLDGWEQCDKSTVVGLVHVSFVRPRVLKIPQILKYKGQVLCTSGAKWALPLEYVCSHSVVCELDISGTKAPIHLAMQGFGYNAEEPGGMGAVSSGKQETNSNRLNIASAALNVLENAPKPQSKEEIYANIVEEGLYQFGAKRPVSVLAVELNRHCRDTEYSNPASEPIFGKTHDGKFFALSNVPQELEDWLVDLEHDEPQLLDVLMPYGICSEISYTNAAHNLSRATRDKLDIYRYQTLSRSIDMSDPEHFLKILPESLRRVDLSLLGLTARLTNIFNQQSVHCLADLDGVSLVTMMGWSNFGRKSAKDLCEILSINFEKLMDQVSMVKLKQVEIKDLDVDEGLGLDENYQIEKISATPLKNHFENALAQLKDRDRVIIEHRTGYHGKVMTLEEVGKLFDVTRERVRQLQKKIRRSNPRT